MNLLENKVVGLLRDIRAASRKFQIGDWVWYYYPPIGNRKLGCGWFGPYLVVDIKSDVNYEIQEPPRSKCKIVHVDQLNKFEGEPPCEAWKPREANELGCFAEELPEIGTSATDIESADNEPNEPNLDSANEEVIVEESVEPTSEVEGKSLEGDSDETLPRRSKRHRKPRVIYDVNIIIVL